MALVPLYEALDHRRARVGGKALALARLAARGLPVPPGLVITSSVLWRVLAQNDILELAGALAMRPDPGLAEELRERILQCSLPQDLAADLQREARALGPSLAVRSSAAEEDGHRASHAGMYTSIIGVAPGEQLTHAILECWAGTFQPAALEYRARAGFRGLPSMALLVQRLVEARAAGVAFTVNALTGDWRELLVEAALGQGEAVVGGLVAPDLYVLSRPRRLPASMARATAHVRLEILDQVVHHQEERLVARGGELRWEPVPPSLQGRAKLDTREVLAVSRLALRAEALFRGPVDMEWAMDQDGTLFVLQARPVTSHRGPHRDPAVLWTRRFIGERWSGPASSLGWSLVQPLLEHFVAYPRTADRFLGGEPPFRLVDGVPFLNATIFRHLAFKLPGLPPPRFMLDMLPPEEERDWLRRAAAWPDLRVYTSLLQETFAERRWRRFRWNPLTNHLAWDRWEADLLPRLAELTSGAGVEPPDAIRRAREGMDLARGYVKIHVISLLFANLLYQLTQGLLTTWLGHEGRAMARTTLRAPSESFTVLTNHALWRLARQARDLRADLTRPPTPEEPLFGPFQAFMGRYGHRTHATWEVMAPRWVEQPHVVLALLEQSLAAGDDDPMELARLQEAQAEEALRRLAERGGARRRILLELVALTRRYLLLRENQRFRFDQLLFTVKSNYLVLGRAWAAAGHLERPEDIQHLTADEVEGFLDGALDPALMSPTVGRRSGQRRGWSQDALPDFLVGDLPSVGSGEGACRLTGLGTSPGVVRGRVRVVSEPGAGSQLRKGEILVARATDPGWAPLFLAAGGIVLELGSQLSHGSVVAREYRIPMVVNVQGVTRRLQDGQEVVVDGTRGAVWVHGH